MRILKKLTAIERDLLSIWKANKISNKECARRLRRDKSTIGRKLKRNSFKGVYVAIHAQARATKRQWKKAHAKKPLKNSDIYAYVTKKAEGWMES